MIYLSYSILLKIVKRLHLIHHISLRKRLTAASTAIIRLVKKIGFKNYNDFKLNIHSLLNKYTLSNMRIMSNEDLYTIKNKLAEIETGIINQTKENLNSNVFNEVMTIISRNKYIDIIANDANANLLVNMEVIYYQV